MAKEKNTGLICSKFGRLTVIGEVPAEERKNKKHRELICKCDCGNIKIIRMTNLKSGNTKSCGCYEKELITKRNTAKVLGKRFGRLVVVDYERDYLNPNRYRYICKCDCGNMHTAIASDLLRGLTKSCGCYRKEFHKKRKTEDITGQTFNELTAIKQLSDFIGSGNYRRTKWLFRCSCGKEIEALAVNVKHGKTKSCGHIGESVAEYEISKWLLNNNIRFEREVTFDDLRNPATQYKLKYDFKVYRNNGTFFIIEHQGKQHFSKKSVHFGKQQRDQTDKIKQDYCKEKGIALYETLYNEDYIAKLEDIIREEIEQDGEVYESEVKQDG